MDLPAQILYDTCSLLTKEEVELHFLIVSAHHDGTSKTSSEHTTIIREFSKRLGKRKTAMLDAVDNSLADRVKAIVELAGRRGGDDAQQLVAELTRGLALGV